MQTNPAVYVLFWLFVLTAYRRRISVPAEPNAGGAPQLRNRSRRTTKQRQSRPPPLYPTQQQHALHPRWPGSRNSLKPSRMRKLQGLRLHSRWVEARVSNVDQQRRNVDLPLGRSRVTGSVPLRRTSVLPSA